jgi:hypothetical protein
MKLALHFLLTLWLVTLLCQENLQTLLNKKKLALHHESGWVFLPSLALDAIGFLEVLKADPASLNYYQQEYEHFASQLTPAARTALSNLAREIEYLHKSDISEFLSLCFSVTENRTLEDLLRRVEESAQTKKTLEKTVYYSESAWQLFESVRGDLKILFSFLKSSQFEAYWKENSLPKINQEIDALQKDISKYDAPAEIEKILGFRPFAPRITIFVLRYMTDGDFRLAGSQSIAGPLSSLRSVMHNALHALLHPPYDILGDKELRENLDILRTDAFLAEKITTHNPSLGYDTFERFIEENSVQALEQIIAERFNLAKHPRERWREDDPGLPVFAVALYSLMREENFGHTQETFREFLLRMIRLGKLAIGKIETLFKAFYAQREI